MSLGTEVLLAKRSDLIIKRDKMLEQFNIEISQIETAIEILAGKKVWETPRPYIYDDESPNYIRQSPEEM